MPPLLGSSIVQLCTLRSGKFKVRGRFRCNWPLRLEFHGPVGRSGPWPGSVDGPGMHRSAAIIAAAAVGEVDMEVIAVGVIRLRAEDGAKDAAGRAVGAAQKCSTVECRLRLGSFLGCIRQRFGAAEIAARCEQELVQPLSILGARFFGTLGGNACLTCF